MSLRPPAPKRLTPFWPTAFLLAVMALAGWAGPGGLFASRQTTPAFRDPAMSMQAAFETVTIGQSTKEQVASALGPAKVVTFDSGFEVWVYQATNAEGPAANAELVILFAPSSVVQKIRIRSAS